MSFLPIKYLFSVFSSNTIDEPFDFNISFVLSLSNTYNVSSVISCVNYSEY